MLRAITVIAMGLLSISSIRSEAAEVQPAKTSKAITNADLVSMTAAKLSDEVVIGAVQQASATDFDLSPKALISLKSAGVSDRVIHALQIGREIAAPPIAVEPNPSRARDTAAATVPASEPCRIFITEEEPPSRMYVVVRSEVQVAKKLYGDHDDGLTFALAKQADKVGADAIIKYHEWRAPSAWSWAAAKEGGVAVKWTAEGKTAVSTFRGRCWSPNS